MKNKPLNYLPDLINAHFTNDNNSFESVLLSLIRLLAKDDTNKKIVEKLSKSLSQHQAGLSPDYGNIRSIENVISRKDEDDEFLIHVTSDIMLDDLILNKQTRSKIDNIIISYKNKNKLESAGLNFIQKIMLNGEPGTGKSSIGMAIAKELDLEAYIVKIPSLFSSYLGDSGKTIMNLFKSLKQKKAVIIFDEFDSVAINRSASNEIGEMRRIVNTVLTNLDDWSSESLLIATTNDRDSLDSAVWRRFDERIDIDLPDKKSRSKLWQIYTKNNLNRDELFFITEVTKGYSPAEIEIYSQQALRMKILKDKNVFLTIIEQVNLSIENKILKKKISNFIKVTFPKITTREIGDLLGISKSSVQRYLNEGDE